jgi:hypothetical protein
MQIQSAMATTIEEQSNKNIYWHYTTLERFAEIMESGVILPATAYVGKNEKPVAWFSANQFWEQTANKSILLYGQIRGLTRKEMFHLGVARIGVSIETAPYDWEGFKKLSGISNRVSKGLVAAAKNAKSNPKDWRVSFEPVIRDKWLRIEVWQSGKWESLQDIAAEADNKDGLQLYFCRAIEVLLNFVNVFGRSYL